MTSKTQSKKEKIFLILMIVILIFLTIKTSYRYGHSSGYNDFVCLPLLIENNITNVTRTFYDSEMNECCYKTISLTKGTVRCYWMVDEKKIKESYMDKIK